MEDFEQTLLPRLQSPITTKVSCVSIVSLLLTDRFMNVAVPAPESCESCALASSTADACEAHIRRL